MKVLVVSKKTDYEFDESTYRAKLKGIYESRNVSLEEKLRRHEEHYSFVKRVLSFLKKRMLIMFLFLEKVILLLILKKNIILLLLLVVMVFLWMLQATF